MVWGHIPLHGTQIPSRASKLTCVCLPLTMRILGNLHILLDTTGRLIGKQWWLELLNFLLLTSIWDQAGSVRFLPLHSAWEGKQFLINAICGEKIEVSADVQPQLRLFSNA